VQKEKKGGLFKSVPTEVDAGGDWGHNIGKGRFQLLEEIGVTGGNGKMKQQKDICEEKQGQLSTKKS